MNNFNTSNVRWKTWSPENVIFKSNQLIKKLLPSEHILSWKSKGDRDGKMCQQTGQLKTKVNQFGGQPYTYYSKDNYKGVMVQLTDLKSDFPSANIDFIDWTERKDSVGNRKCNLDVLVYLNSFHQSIEWVRCPTTHNWIKKNIGKISPLREGYRMSYGGQGDANAMDFDEFHEIIQITEMIRDFLVDIVIPFKNGDYLVAKEDLVI